MDNLLSILTFIPLLAALILAVFLRGDDEAAQRNAKWLAVTATGATFLVALILWGAFDPAMDGFQFVEERAWPLGLTYKVGVDGLSLGLCLAVAGLTPLAVAASWRIAERVRDYIIALLTAETFILGALLSLDLVFFAIFLEGALVPLLVMAGLWGGKGAGQAALKVFLYALPGAVLLIVTLATMANNAATTDMDALMRHNLPSGGESRFPGGLQTWLLLGLAWSLAVKLPLWPLHAWLPGLAARAPAAATLMVAGTGAILGLYMLLRLAVPMLPMGLMDLWPYATGLALFSFAWAALAAYVQERMRGALAYLAMALAAIPLLAALSGSAMGIDAAILGAAARALTLAGLFVALTMVEARLRSDAFEAMGGIRLRLPGFSILLMALCYTCFGLPGTAAFPVLALAVLGAFEAHAWLAVALVLAVLGLGAVAAGLYRQIALGDLLREDVRTMGGMDARERLAMGLALGALVLLGLIPGLLLDRTGPAAAALAESYAAATSAPE
ncbi:MAG: NADH-quinone oxidoreductase subunit M [Pseudomonadota bacterium]